MKVILTICIFVFTTMSAMASEPFNIGEKRILSSKILGEDRPYYVYVPKSYGENKYLPKKYPVLYILDGEDHFHSASGMINYMSATANQIPELIVVAIPNTKDRMQNMTPTQSLINYDGKEQKSLSTSGGGDKFLEYIEKELIPEIEANYRTVPHRTFVGHSLGGLIVLHSLFTQPGIFQNYIAIDSSLWWDNQIMNKRAEGLDAESIDSNSRVYMTVGGQKTTGKFKDAIIMLISNMRFVEYMQKSKIPNLKLKFQQFPKENHGTVPILSLYYGLLYGFEGYEADAELMFGDVKGISDHYKVFSETFGLNFLPPENTVDIVAAYQIELKDIEAARKLLELNVKNYPNSENAKATLAKFVKDHGLAE